MNYFKDKVAWITGASSGIGKELAIQLNKAGAKLILSARSEDKLHDLHKSLNNEEHLVLPLDLNEPKTFTEKVNQVLEKFTEIHFLFNSGGISQRANAFETNINVDRQIMEVNYFGNIALTKAILPVFQKQKFGHIIVTSSIAGKFGFYLRSAYAASKHALHGFYESLRLEEAKNQIAVTIVCPGKIFTPISLNALDKEGNKHNIMDHSQDTGMPVEVCVNHMLKATQKRKKEVLIGNKEIFAVYIKRFFPALFWKIIKNQKAT